MLYLTYSGVGSDGKVLFQDVTNFDKSIPSLEDEGGLIPDHPDRDERAKRLANRK
jgi:hypothetical protein